MTLERMDAMRYLLSLDQGTTSSRAVLFDTQGMPVFTAQYEFPQKFPAPGWVEQDARDILRTQLTAARDCLAHLAPGDTVAAIGITNQRETTIVWDRHTGEPVCDAIVWQCRRTADVCQKLIEGGMSEVIREKTGLRPDAYFSGTKLQWILRHVLGAAARATRGELLFGTVDSWLIWNLTGGRVHATDATNASRTMLFNIHTQQWDTDLLDLLGIPSAMLPEVRDSAGSFGTTDPAVLGAEIPILSCIGDQQSALFGQRCFDPGDVKNTYGTGGFLLMDTGRDCIESRSGLLTTIAWRRGGQVTYALEGSVFVSGAVIKWLRDELGIIRTAAETEALAQSVPDNGGVWFVPAFVGLGTPYWDSDARGLLCGLTRGTTRAHIVRAALEAIAFQTADVIRAMEADTGALGTVRVDGGAAQNGFLMQFQTDILDRPLLRPACTEATARGAAYLAGIEAGIWDLDTIRTLPDPAETFSPTMGPSARDALLSGWQLAIQRTRLTKCSR